MGSRVQAQLPAGVVASAWGEQGHRVGWGLPAGSLTTSPLDALYRKALGTCVSTSPDPHWPDARRGSVRRPPCWETSLVGGGQVREGTRAEGSRQAGSGRAGGL